MDMPLSLRITISGSAAGSGVVEPLKAQSAAHGAVADQGQDTVILSLERAARAIPRATDTELEACPAMNAS